MDIKSEIKIFIAATEDEWLPAKVLEYSIRKHSSLPVSCNLIYEFNKEIPQPAAKENKPRTPFSFQRFLIPELCNYKGRAIYLDSDMLVLDDIAKIWKMEMGAAPLLTVKEGPEGRVQQFSVMLLNCELLNWNIKEIVTGLNHSELSYKQLMYEMILAPNWRDDIPSAWNALEYYDSETCLVHFTDMNTQPWIFLKNRNSRIWLKNLQEAIDDGFITSSDIEREVKLKKIRPSLLLELNDSKTSVVSIKVLKKADKGFIAPFRRLDTGHGRPWRNIRGAISILAHRLRNLSV